MDMKLANNLEELGNLMLSRMAAYEDKLEKVAGGSSSNSVHSDITSLSREFMEFRSFVLDALTKFKTQIELVSLGFDKHETLLRRKILLFHGLPEKSEENLHDTIFKTISAKMKVTDVIMDNLSVCHRLGSSQGKSRPVLVRFFDMEQRQAVWEKKTALKGTGITITEFLTQTRQRVFLAARKHFGVKYTWTVEGRIVVLLPNKSRRKIQSMMELQDLIVQYPSTPGEAETVSVEPTSPKNAAPKANNPSKKTRRIR